MCVSAALPIRQATSKKSMSSENFRLIIVKCKIAWKSAAEVKAVVVFTCSGRCSIKASNRATHKDGNREICGEMTIA